MMYAAALVLAHPSSEKAPVLGCSERDSYGDQGESMRHQADCQVTVV